MGTTAVHPLAIVLKKLIEHLEGFREGKGYANVDEKCCRPFACGEGAEEAPPASVDPGIPAQGHRLSRLDPVSMMRLPYPPPPSRRGKKRRR